MNAHIPHSNPRRPSHQRGVSMIEVAVWSVILGVVVATVLSYFNGVKGRLQRRRRGREDHPAHQ